MAYISKRNTAKLHIYKDGVSLCSDYRDRNPVSEIIDYNHEIKKWDICSTCWHEEWKLEYEIKEKVNFQIINI